MKVNNEFTLVDHEESKDYYVHVKNLRVYSMKQKKKTRNF